MLPFVLSSALKIIFVSTTTFILPGDSYFFSINPFLLLWIVYLHLFEELIGQIANKTLQIISFDMCR